MGSNGDSFWDDVAHRGFENEAAVETRLILPLLRALGYEPEDIYPKYPVEFQEGRRGRKPEADFVLFAEKPYSRATSLIVIEAKPPNEGLGNGKSQGESYAANIRTPLLIITNGRRLEVWQLQPTTESELVLECSISELKSRRGEIEALLAKNAVIAYSQTLRHKSFGLLARDLGAYERAEFQRPGEPRYSIVRRLKQAGPTVTDSSSVELLQVFPDGAMVVGGSGYGKTTLISALRRQAIERRWSNESVKLPIEVFLPDAFEHREGLEAYLHARVHAHCPNVTPRAFTDRLRDEGIVLLCDAFDRISPNRRSSVEGALVNFRRDYPTTQLLLATRQSARPERLPLASLELQGLDDEEQRDFTERFCGAENLSRPLLWYDVPNVLKEVCRHPLILNLVLISYKEHGRLPTEIEPLFVGWLDHVIPQAVPIERRVDLRRLLTIIANETVSRPMREDEAVALIRHNDFSHELLQDLLGRDALTRREHTIELQHEALADYLRACDITQCQPSDVSARLNLLSSLSLRASSQLPALLMATARSAEMQRIVWFHIAAADIEAAISALRYRADTSSQLDTSDPIQISRHYLSEILEGAELPLALHFDRLASRARSELAGEEAERLGIEGSISPDQNRITYSFAAAVPERDRIVIGTSFRRGMFFGMDLRMMGLRLDSGRLIGVGHVRDALLDLVRHRRLDGRLVWAEERALSRLRYLIRDRNFPCGLDTSLVEVQTQLAPYAGSWVHPDSFRTGQTFKVDELIGDVTLLCEHGRTHLEPWWDGADPLDLQSSEGRVRLAKLLDVYYRRVQLAYREVAEVSFPFVAEKFPYNQVMPVRYEIEVEFYNRRGFESESLHWTWIPVAKFEDAGADVTFPSELTDIHSGGARIVEALARFGRPAPDRMCTCGVTGIPDFFGHGQDHGGQHDETSVVRSAANHIEDGLMALFRELPNSDHGL